MRIRGALWLSRGDSCVLGTHGAISSLCTTASTKTRHPANSSAAAAACNQRDGGTSPRFTWLRIVPVPLHFLLCMSKNAQPQPFRAHPVPSIKPLIWQQQQGSSPWHQVAPPATSQSTDAIVTCTAQGGAWPLRGDTAGSRVSHGLSSAPQHQWHWPRWLLNLLQDGSELGGALWWWHLHLHDCPLLVLPSMKCIAWAHRDYKSQGVCKSSELAHCQDTSTYIHTPTYVCKYIIWMLIFMSSILYRGHSCVAASLFAQQTFPQAQPRWKRR